MKTKHNVVLMILDTQRADRLSCYGYPLETTPHLDQFSKQATKFEYAIAAAQWTVPTHASIFTGSYPSQHALLQMESSLPAQATTLAERLYAAGYKTVGISHNPLIGQMRNGLSRGFQQFKSYSYLGAGLLTYQLNKTTKDKRIPVWLRAKARSCASELLGYGDSLWLENISPLTFRLWQSLLQISGRTKHLQMRQSLQLAIDGLKTYATGKDSEPVFTFINLMGTHVPYAPPAWALSRFLPKHLKKGTDRLLRDANKWQVDVKNWLALQEFEEESQAILSAIYDAEVAGQDAEVGWFLNELKRTGLMEKTMVIIVADHGDHLGEKNRLNHAFGVYKELTHVPLLIFDPSDHFSRNRTVRKPISTRRIFHSILSVTGVANEDEARLSMANYSEIEKEVTITEGMPLNWAINRLEKVRPGVVSSLGNDTPTRAIFDDGYKLIINGDELALYQYETDANEEIDLSIQRSKEAISLKEKLLQWQRLSKPLPTCAKGLEDDEVVLAHLRALGYIE